MNEFVETARSASYRDGSIDVVFESGAEVHFPVMRNPRLAKGTPAQLGNIEISPNGLHWPELDEDLSFHGMLSGDFGQIRKKKP